MESKKRKRERKPDYDRLSISVQALLRPSEAKVFERLRRDLGFPTNAAYLRAIILKTIEKKNQTELL